MFRLFEKQLSSDLYERFQVEILFKLVVPESLYHVCILQARIRDGIFFVYNIRNFGSVLGSEFTLCSLLALFN